MRDLASKRTVVCSARLLHSQKMPCVHLLVIGEWEQANLCSRSFEWIFHRLFVRRVSAHARLRLRDSEYANRYEISQSSVLLYAYTRRVVSQPDRSRP